MTARRNGSQIRGGSKSKDNQNVAHKVHIRRLVTKELDKVSVLDLFAGRGVVWSRVGFDEYTGVEVKRGKNRNENVILGDNRKVIPTLDLSRYNVIDCDSYGVPADQIALLYENGTMRSGTTVLYTCISNKVSTMPSSLQDYAGIRGELYHKAQTLFNGHSIPLFFDFLASMGVSRVWEYEEPVVYGGYVKKYGYFIV